MEVKGLKKGQEVFSVFFGQAKTRTSQTKLSKFCKCEFQVSPMFKLESLDFADEIVRLYLCPKDQSFPMA